MISFNNTAKGFVTSVLEERKNQLQIIPLTSLSSVGKKSLCSLRRFRTPGKKKGALKWVWLTPLLPRQSCQCTGLGRSCPDSSPQANWAFKPHSQGWNPAYCLLACLGLLPVVHMDVTSALPNCFMQGPEPLQLIF